MVGSCIGCVRAKDKQCRQPKSCRVKIAFSRITFGLVHPERLHNSGGKVAGRQAGRLQCHAMSCHTAKMKHKIISNIAFYFKCSNVHWIALKTSLSVSNIGSSFFFFYLYHIHFFYPCCCSWWCWVCFRTRHQHPLDSVQNVVPVVSTWLFSILLLLLREPTVDGRTTDSMRVIYLSLGYDLRALNAILPRTFLRLQSLLFEWRRGRRPLDWCCFVYYVCRYVCLDSTLSSSLTILYHFVVRIWSHS